jgi:hypothetical protein
MRKFGMDPPSAHLAQTDSACRFSTFHVHVLCAVQEPVLVCILEDVLAAPFAETLKGVALLVAEHSLGCKRLVVLEHRLRADGAIPHQWIAFRVADQLVLGVWLVVNVHRLPADAISKISITRPVICIAILVGDCSWTDQNRFVANQADTQPWIALW